MQRHGISAHLLAQMTPSTVLAMRGVNAAALRIPKIDTVHMISLNRSMCEMVNLQPVNDHGFP